MSSMITPILPNGLHKVLSETLVCHQLLLVVVDPELSCIVHRVAIK